MEDMIAPISTLQTTAAPRCTPHSFQPRPSSSSNLIVSVASTMEVADQKVLLCLVFGSFRKADSVSSVFSVSVFPVIPECFHSGMKACFQYEKERMLF